MTDTSNWEYYYKMKPDGSIGTSNMLYVPKVNSDQTVMCMCYSTDPNYKDNDKVIPEDLTQWFFEREVKFLNKFSNLKTTPEVYDVDYKNRKIFIEWNKETLSQVLYDPSRNINNECPNWETQIKDFLISTKENNFYKMALYPHCFYISNSGQLKTIDYYSVVPFEERFIERNIIESIIGKDGAYRFDESTDNGYIDFKKFFEITLTRHLPKLWPTEVFTNTFKEIYND
jgi:hypothetical protein